MSKSTLQNKSVIELSELKLVGFRVLCPGDQYVNEIPKASSQLSERIGEISNVINPLQQIGAFVVENETDNEDGYWICVEVNEYENIPDEMITLTIPSQRYAVVRHKGPNDEIRDAYEDLHKWIEETNYLRLTNKWHLEKFYSWTDIKNIDVELFDTIN
ncbi:GyrI-like domain-containing protein [Sporosarcina sp. ACRSL]|uniref:GyrI-like domain-containing protein n=1 Tax=Sporosarcina sp. ACRSL TaxID=2918215 RepID=UPI001EF48050|nr:GyrI-like domain-containing protein [Sporosarcina sp. ACRSL]